MKISLLIPSYNEEKSLAKCLESAILQTRQLDQIVIVNDGSTDNTVNILDFFSKKYPNIQAINLTQNTGNKSKAQEKGIPYITGEIVIMTDGDTLLDKDFAKNIEQKFIANKNKKVAAVGGYVSSLKHNWITACREIDYIIGQNIFKKAQSIIGYVYVMPGCATAIRTSVLRELSFNHDTVTEDLDFTFQIHLKDLRILYDMKSKVYTQDPPNLSSYIRQMGRWYGGGWQNIKKYYPIILKKKSAGFVLSTIFIDGTIYSALTLLFPIFYPKLFITFILPSLFLTAFIFSLYAAIKTKRYDLMLYFPHYVFIGFINSIIIGHEFIKEIILQKSDLVWKKADRVSMEETN